MLTAELGWQGLVSDEHSSVDGTLIETWASHKSFVKRDGSGPEIGFKGEECSNTAHQSATDSEARVYKKGKFTAAKLHYMIHVLSENYSDLIVDVEMTHATRTAEVETAKKMIRRTVFSVGTVGADKGYGQPVFANRLTERQAKAPPTSKAAVLWTATRRGARDMLRVCVAGQALFCFTAYNLTRLLNLLTTVSLPSAGRTVPV